MCYVHPHISYVHVQHIAWLTEHQQENNSHLHTDAQPPYVNDYEMEMVSGHATQVYSGGDQTTNCPSVVMRVEALCLILSV